MCPYSYNPLLVGKLDINKKTLNDLEDINTAGTVNDKVLTYQNGTWIPQTPAGGGDMTRAVYDVNANDIVDNSERLEGETLGSVQAHGVDAGTITSGTIALARIPAIDDARIPDLETLSYGAAFGTAQIPSIGAYKVASGTLGIARIPTMDDAHIPDLDTLSYSAAFGTAQIPSLGAYKIASGTLNADRIPALPTTKITSGTFNADRIPILPTDRYGSAVLVSGTRPMTGDFDFAKHQAKAMAFEVLGSAPASPATAQMYYNSGDDKVYVYVA